MAAGRRQMYNIIMSDNIEAFGHAGPVGAQIRRLREVRGWSLAELARRAGTSAPSLHRYEGGWDRFEVGTLRKIAAALGAQLEVRLICGERRARKPRRPSGGRLVRLLAPLFWDRDLSVADLEGYPHWVLRRVLMFGNGRQAAAVRSFYGDDAVLEAVEHRSVDARTRAYWTLLLGEKLNAS
jgi:transcriptional regulator with XRE-family HTH domain